MQIECNECLMMIPKTRQENLGIIKKMYSKVERITMGLLFYPRIKVNRNHIIYAYIYHHES